MLCILYSKKEFSKLLAEIQDINQTLILTDAQFKQVKEKLENEMTERTKKLEVLESNLQKLSKEYKKHYERRQAIEERLRAVEEEANKRDEQKRTFTVADYIRWR